MSHASKQFGLSIIVLQTESKLNPSHVTWSMVNELLTGKTSHVIIHCNDEIWWIFYPLWWTVIISAAVVRRSINYPLLWSIEYSAWSQHRWGSLGDTATTREYIMIPIAQCYITLRYRILLVRLLHQLSGECDIVLRHTTVAVASAKANWTINFL